MADDTIYKADTTPGAGTYQCTVCGYQIELKNDEDILIVCPLCGATEYIKVS